MPDKVFIDTNVLIYGYSEDEPVDILAAVKRTAIPHHATFLEWSLNGVDATRDAASLTEVLRFPLR
ncbi:hypothetical protein PN467_06390, partial [Microcystis aeruginosa CS-563/04]|nr:hypothetical protein [Microcystis aeruginosa CS-563/04]